ncbi:MAG: ABC transporter ATP-binding protein [Firmicutes bacterium]|nr:ABC transporter ATP-binding protein [Candidatus Caballimonas caccae]
MKSKKENISSIKKTIKVLSGSIREYKKPSILAPLFVSFEVILEVFIPLVMTWLLREIEQSQNNADYLMREVIKYGVILVLLAIASLACGALSGKYCAEASTGFAKNLRKDMYYKIQNFSFSNIDKFSSSSLVTRMTTDVTNVEMSYMMIIRVAVRAPLLLIFALGMSFFISWRMALIFLATTPILTVGLILIIRKAFPLFNKIFPKYDKLNESVEENIKGMRVVKSYVREDYEMEKFEKASESVKTDFTKAEKLVALNNPLMNFCIYMGLILIYLVGSILIVKGNQSALKLTELQSFMTYSFQMLMSLMMLSMILVMLVISVASAKRIAEVLNEESTITSKADALMEVKDGSVSFKNVFFKYSAIAERDTLSNIDFDIKSGETVGIIGSTGSGKSTLVNLIPRLYDVTSGEVLVGGENVKDYDLDALRNAVACVLQKNVLFSGTLRDNMKWGNKEATDEEIIEALKLAQIPNFNLDKKIEQGGVNVSGGQKQRLCIARALLKKPKILILDDSTSAVDTKTDALIRKSFKEYIPTTTKIIIAQRIASVQDADKIIIMENGTVSAIGNHNELLKGNQIYQELYYSQNKVNAEKEVK